VTIVGNDEIEGGLVLSFVGASVAVGAVLGLLDGLTVAEGMTEAPIDGTDVKEGALVPSVVGAPVSVGVVLGSPDG